MPFLSFDFSRINKLHITDSEYQEIENARNFLLCLWEIEDAFSLFGESYLDFEKEVFSQALIQDSKYDGEFTLHGARAKINLKFTSLLNHGKAYFSLTCRHAKYQEGISSSVEKIFSKEYSENLNYRLAYELRNISQHSMLPIHSLSFRSSWKTEGGKFFDEKPRRRSASISPKIDLSKIAEFFGKKEDMKPKIL